MTSAPTLSNAGHRGRAHRLPLAAPIQKTTNPDVAAGGNYMAGTDTIGIMSTPVIDPSSQVMYLVAGQQNGASWKWKPR